MRLTNSGATVSVRAIAGSNVVVLAWDLREFDPKKPDPKELLGFAIERTEYNHEGIVERYFLRGIKRFRDKDEGVPGGTPVPTSEHPIQSFQWGDYTAKPSTRYTYRIVPATGIPKALTLRDDLAVGVEVTTEPVYGDAHSIFFNRGVAGSQAYARKFASSTPDPEDPDSDQMKWLSRGLFEALIEFVGRAKDETYALRAALYEFHYPQVGKAFKAALKERHVDVKILYDEPNYGDENSAMITELGLSRVCAPRSIGGAQKHNKFIVLLKDGEPVEVWTGSTNISAGGIFGHSNVGHIVHDPTVAEEYLRCWTELCNAADPPPAKTTPFRDSRTDPGASALRAQFNALAPTPAALPPTGSIMAMFSPRNRETLRWYADRMAGAREMACMTVAFTLANVFEPFLDRDSDVLRFVLCDKSLKQGDAISRHKNVLYAAGAKLEKDSLENFLAEVLTGLNKNYYIHNKFMLLDPLSDDPTVVTGSANFSYASQESNDENMLVIRGDKRVADIYFGEFMRIFDHLYARYLAKKFKEASRDAKAKKSTGGYLRPDASWVADHFGEGTKSRRRVVFHGDWKT